MVEPTRLPDRKFQVEVSDMADNLLAVIETDQIPMSGSIVLVNEQRRPVMMVAVLDGNVEMMVGPPLAGG